MAGLGLGGLYVPFQLKPLYDSVTELCCQEQAGSLLQPFCGLTVIQVGEV